MCGSRCKIQGETINLIQFAIIATVAESEQYLKSITEKMDEVMGN